jgi:hypothetical protein
MATLTIKPTAAGNDVQIKSGDGNTTHATFGDNSSISGTLSTGSIASAVTFPAGHIIQVASNYSNSVTTSWSSGSTGTYYDTGVLATFTPTSSSNKVLVLAMATMGHTINGEGQWRIMRNINSGGWNFPSAVGDASGGAQRSQVGGMYDDIASSETYTQHASWLDAPATALSISYRIEMMRWDGTMYMNRPDTNSNQERAIGITSITIMEVQQ